MKNNFIETFVTVCLVILALLLLNPFEFWMPNMMVIGMLAGTLGLFGLYASVVMRENMGDERDAQHRALAGRNAFLAGSGVLILGVVVQGYFHVVDPWLAVALITMIITKIGTREWSDRNR